MRLKDVKIGVELQDREKRFVGLTPCTVEND
jgi:hypothetical protein